MTSRARIVEAVRAALEPLESAVALWEGGSAAFGRVDEWSDVDLQAAVDDDAVEEAFAAVERALPPVESKFRVPEPTWHGHAQAFYRFRDEPPWLLLDLCVMKRSSDRRFNERERHGEPPVLFDKAGWVQVTALDPAPHADRLRARLEQLCARFEMFEHMVAKSLRRGHDIEANAFYQTLVWRPLVELLRMRHDPARFDFGPRYLPYDLPAGAVERVRRLAFVKDAADLESKHAEAVAWLRELASETR